MLVRMGIVVLGLLPLLATTAFVTVSRTQWYKLRQAAAWRMRILSNTGLDAVFASVEMPSPNRFVIRDMVVTDPETKTSILWADEVRGDMTPNGWAVAIQNAHIKPEKTDLALKILHDEFLCRPHNAVPILKLSMGELHLMLQSDAAPGTTALSALQDILVEYAPSEVSSEIKVRYSVKNAGQQSPSLVHVVRNHDAANLKTEWAIDTNDGALPCSVLARYFPVLRNVGDMAEFQGQVRWSQDALGWDCRIENGRFDHCSWDKLTQEIGSPLQGNGALVIYNAKLRNGMLESVQGAFASNEAEEVTVDSEWLKESARAFRWVSDDLNQLASKRAKVAGLNIAFNLTHRGIQWLGSGPMLPNRDNQPSYQQLATVEGLRVATELESSGIAINANSIGQWLDRSSVLASGNSASGSQFGNATVADNSSDSSSYSRWQSQIASFLTPPSSVAGPVSKVSALPNNASH